MSNYHKEQKAVLHHLRNSANIFVAMEQITPNELTYDWLENCFEKYGKAKSWKSLTGFLIRKKMIRLPSDDSKYKKQCMNYIEKVPANFQKCLKWYVEDKFALQERQIANNASSPIKSRTIETDMCSLFRMVRWITENYIEVDYWSDITETMVNQFLLSLPSTNRECTRKDLYQFLKFAKRKRCIFVIPMTDYKTRESPRIAEALTHEEQIALYKKIIEEGISFPYEALLTSLCFLHAVQPMKIVEIKLSAFDVERKSIRMNDIPDIYLMSIEMVLLKEYLLLRQTYPNQKTNSHLFIRRNRGDYLPDATASILVKDNILESWRVKDTDKLFELAKKNTQHLLRGTVSSMMEVMTEIIYDDTNDLPSEFVDEFFDMSMDEDNAMSMHVATNTVTVLLQEKVEEGYLGRVFGVMAMISSVMMPLGMLVFGPLSDIVKIDWLLVVTGILLFLQSFFLIGSKDLVEAEM